MAAPIEAFRAVGFFDGVVAAGDDRQSALVFDLLADLLAVIGLVGSNGERRPRRVQDLFDCLTVVDLTAGQREIQRPALAVDNRVDFAGAAAPALPDRLILLPPFAPLAARWAFTIVLSIR